MCPAIEIEGLGFAVGSTRWAPKLADIGAVATHAASIVANHAHRNVRFLSIAADLWKLDKMLRDAITGIYRDAETPVTDIQDARIPSHEDLMAAVQSLRNIHSRIDRMHGTARAAGLTNRALTGAVLNSVLVRSDELLEIAESVEMSLNPAVDAYFEKALSDLSKGEVFDLAQFR